MARHYLTLIGTFYPRCLANDECTHFTVRGELQSWKIVVKAASQIDSRPAFGSVIEACIAGQDYEMEAVSDELLKLTR